MKIKPADTWFSKCVRHSKNWTCEKCGSVHEPGSMGMHTSHIVPRRYRALRWCLSNVQCLCFPCHKWFGSEPYESGLWIRKFIGDGMMDLLIEKKNQTIKVTKAEEKEISAHYRKEYNRMISENDNDFESWQ